MGAIKRVGDVAARTVGEWRTPYGVHKGTAVFLGEGVELGNRLSKTEFAIEMLLDHDVAVRIRS